MLYSYILTLGKERQHDASKYCIFFGGLSDFLPQWNLIGLTLFVLFQINLIILVNGLLQSASLQHFLDLTKNASSQMLPRHFQEIKILLYCSPTLCLEACPLIWRGEKGKIKVK